MKVTVMTFTSVRFVIPGGDLLWGGPYEHPLTPGKNFSMPVDDAEVAKAILADPTGSSAECIAIADSHFQVYKEQVECAYKAFGDRLTLCVCHAMKDCFSFSM